MRALRVIDNQQSMLVLVGLIRKNVNFAEQSLSGGDLVLTRRRERVLNDDVTVPVSVPPCPSETSYVNESSPKKSLAKLYKHEVSKHVTSPFAH